MNSIGSYVSAYSNTDAGEPGFFDPEQKKTDKELTIVIHGVHHTYFIMEFSFDVFYFAHNISPTLSSSETITIPILLKEYPQLPLVLLSLFSYSLKSFYDPYILP